jgi:hypothetical protein
LVNYDKKSPNIINIIQYIYICIYALVNRIQQWLDADITHQKNPLAVGLLADLSAQQQGTIHSLERAIQLFEQLITIDPIRCKSWFHRKEEIELLLETLRNTQIINNNNSNSNTEI